jgi:4-amino-4-deoxy-L-arabinose transferase-like glycosyltransferase
VIGRFSLRTAVIAVVVLALAVRLAAVALTPHFKPVTDAAEYDRSGVSLVEQGIFAPSVATFHGGPTAYHPPLQSLALAGVYELSGTGSAHDRWQAGRILQAILGALAAGLICLIGLRLWRPVIGVVAGALAAVYPPLILVGTTLMSEPLFIVLELAAVLAALVARTSSHRVRWAAVTGVLVGLGSLTRGNGLVLVIPIGFLLWSQRPRRALLALVPPLAMLLATAVTLVPWTVRNASVFHRFVPVTTETGYALAGTYNVTAQGDKPYPSVWEPPFAQVATILRADPRADEAKISSRLTTDGLDYIRRHPASVLKTAFWNTARLLNLTGVGFERWFAPNESYPRGLATASVVAFWILGLILLGGLLTRPVRDAVRRVPAALWGCPLAVFLCAVPLEGSTRYRSPADPFLILAGAVVLVIAAERLRARRPADRHLMTAGAR